MVRANGWAMARVIGYRISSELGQHLGHFFAIGIGLDQFFAGHALDPRYGPDGRTAFFFSALTLGLLLAKRWSSPKRPGLTEAYGRFLGMALGLGAAGLQ